MNRTFYSLLALLLLGCWTTAAYSQSADDKPEAQQAQTADPDESDEAEDDAKEKDAADSDDDEQPKITPIGIGSRAPALDIEHWVQNGEDEFGVVTEFEANRVYVVEFWATWCGPCIAAMPHIVELQEKYADRDVQIISISDEDLETVEEFLDREVRGGEDGKTYRDLTKVYCLTTDPDGSSSRDYMQAANQNGIPCAFLVGKQGRIEWIGHPMSMDEPLEQVVTDQWDREAFAEEYRLEQEADKILSQVSSAMGKGDVDKALEILDDYIENGKLEKQRSRFGEIKLSILLRDGDRDDQVAKWALKLLANKSLDVGRANNLAWNIYQLADRGRFEDEQVTRAALKLAKSKVKESGELRAFLLDTVAHLQHRLGDNKQALRTQRRAVKAASEEERAQLTGFLEELEELEDAAKKKDEAKTKKKDKAESKEGEGESE